ncbi:MAG: DNA repair protein RecN [Opitutales bacterium]
MLQQLTIRNLALLDEVVLDFDAGFTAVTGETGAGKSVLLGALALLSGARSDKSMIRQGCDLLEVEAALYFEDPSTINAELEAQGLPLCEEGALLLQRGIHRSKMPRVRVNGNMATLTQLQALGEEWIDFHGPGEPQKLFREACQLEMLDAYAGNQALLAEYRELYHQWRAELREIEDLESGERLDPEEAAFLKEQIEKIDAVDVSSESIEALERDFNRISSAQELQELASACASGLAEEEGVTEQLRVVIGRLEALVSLDAESSELLERARSVLIELEDLSGEVGRLTEAYEFDPEAAEATAQRMTQWQELRRKYGAGPEAVLAKRAELQRKLDVQGDLDGILKARKESAKEREKELRKHAEKLGKARESAGKTLAKRVSRLLEALGFKKARLEIELKTVSELRESGDRTCRFLFAPNVGQDLMPLDKIASSGETARVMLALKTALAEVDATPLLVFDEVDANVGGEVGRTVGAELARLSGRHQVLCVTHLPQVAAWASNHLVVTKDQKASTTMVSIISLGSSREKRLEELARMLGDRKSDAARAHAEELLAACRT